MAINAVSDMKGEAQQQVEKRWCEKISCCTEGSPHNWVVYLKILIRESLFYVNLECWDRNTPSNSPKGHLAPNQNSGRKGSIARCYERSPCAPKFEDRSREENLTQERCARKATSDLAKHIYKLQNSDKTTFHVPREVKGISTPVTSKRPEEREFAVDAGASMHMMSKKRNLAQKNYGP